MTKLPKTPSFRLDGKKALVTGGSRGIGLGCSVALAEAGAHVIIAARSQAQVEDAAEAIGSIYHGKRAARAPLYWRRECHEEELYPLFFHPRVLDVVDAAARESTRLAREPRQFRDAVVRRRPASRPRQDGQRAALRGGELRPEGRRRAHEARSCRGCGRTD